MNIGNILLFILGFVSILLNGVLLFLTFNRKPIDIVLMAIIASLDLASAVCVFGGSIWKWASGYAVVQDGSVWCHINSLVGWSVSLSALNITALLSLVRYLAIVRGLQMRNPSIILVGVSIITCISLLFIVKQIMNKPLVFTSGMFCFAGWTDGTLLSDVLSYAITVVALPPLIIIPLCYARVIAYYTATVLRPAQGLGMKKVYNHRRSLFIIMACYLVTLLPEYLQAFIAITFKKELIAWVDAICKILIFTVTIVNPIFAFLSHSKIRNDLICLIEPILPYTD
ncbi:hypothetical protein L0F63_001021 [Massospora cicadina]|nr:hypothetical protein L0F63_001021 [Massospora cicadina]